MALSPSPARMTGSRRRHTTRPPHRRGAQATRGTRALRMLVLAVTTSLAALVVATPAQAAYCGITWGSLPKVASGASGAADYLTNVRAGQNACYDRLVIDLNGEDATFGSYDVRYVRRVVADGSGAAVPVRGGAVLQVTVGAPNYDEQNSPTYRPVNHRELVKVGGFRTFRQVAWAGTFEGTSVVGLGVRARLPMRAFTVARADGGHRVVVDVAHRW